MKYSLSESPVASGARRSKARGETTVRAGIGRPAPRQDRVVVLGLGGIDLAIEDGQGDVAPDVERLLELTRMPRSR